MHKLSSPKLRPPPFPPKMSNSSTYTTVTTHVDASPSYTRLLSRPKPSSRIFPVNHQDPYNYPPDAPPAAVATTWNGGNYGPAASPPPGYLNFQQATTAKLGQQPAAIAGIVIAGVAMLVLGVVVYWVAFRRIRRRF